MKTTEEELALVIDTAHAGVSQMPVRMENDCFAALASIERLLKAGWTLKPPPQKKGEPCKT